MKNAGASIALLLKLFHKHLEWQKVILWSILVLLFPYGVNLVVVIVSDNTRWHKFTHVFFIFTHIMG